jgi:hypothetical protein
VASDALADRPFDAPHDASPPSPMPALVRAALAIGSVLLSWSRLLRAPYHVHDRQKDTGREEGVPDDPVLPEDD